MSGIIVPTRRLIRRGLLLLMFAALAGVALGARCIERTSSYVDKDGYTHITGQMVNDTDTQGTQMMLQGTLFDAAGNVVATKTGPTCPPDSQPHDQTVFDLRFDNPNLPHWDHFSVQPIAGSAVPTPLPNPQVVLFFAEAVRFTSPLVLPGFTVTPDDVFFAFRVRNQTNNAYPAMQGCAAVYDQTGRVTFVNSSEILAQDASGNVVPASLGPQELNEIFWRMPNVPTGPVQVRAWIWFGQKGAPTSQYQFVETQMMTIQTMAP